MRSRLAKVVTTSDLAPLRQGNRLWQRRPPLRPLRGHLSPIPWGRGTPNAEVTALESLGSSPPQCGGEVARQSRDGEGERHRRLPCHKGRKPAAGPSWPVCQSPSPQKRAPALAIPSLMGRDSGWGSVPGKHPIVGGQARALLFQTTPARWAIAMTVPFIVTIPGNHSG
jgi:hypothetical protein